VKVLAFDTATRATTVALLDSHGATTEARDDPEAGERPRHTTRLMALIATVLDRAGCAWEEVERIGVGVGPGTFTGLRIGVATARALAQARQIPLVGVSTLESLALGAANEARAAELDVVLAVLDARRGEVFAAAWAADRLAACGARTPLLGPAAVTPRSLADTAVALGRHRMVIGEGAVEFRAVLERSGTVIPDHGSSLHRVNAIHHCRLARHAHPSAISDVLPEYLRLPDAELSLRSVAKR
jgi:tRNA threonylcarbamoyladenosine biosynthesis protein TsaB